MTSGILIASVGWASSDAVTSHTSGTTKRKPITIMSVFDSTLNARVRGDDSEAFFRVEAGDADRARRPVTSGEWWWRS